MSLKISSVGDIMLGENTHHFHRGIPTLFKNRYSQLIDSEVISLINTTDLLFANLECSFIPNDILPSASFSRAVYAAPESAMAFFSPIDPPIVLNVANNHFGQHGREAVAFTLKTLEKNDIICIGQDQYPKTICLRNHKLICWGATLEKGSSPTDVCFQSTPSSLIDSMYWPEKNLGDYWIISLHWGEEYKTQPESWQNNLASELINRGVDLILGHHPHVIQPVKKIGTGIVCFSQGNFIFDQNFSRITQEGLLCKIDLKTSKVETILVRQKKYIVHRQDTAKQWLSQYCKKNYSIFIQNKMRMAMKAELLFHIFNSNLETLHFFFKSALNKIRG